MYLCVSHCKFVIPYLGIHWVSTTASQYLISNLYHMAQNILELFFVYILSLSRHGQHISICVSLCGWLAIKSRIATSPSSVGLFVNLLHVTL